MPIAVCRESVIDKATPLVAFTPSPSIRTIRTGVNAAARNQRNVFQNQDRPPSQTSPAAETGFVAASTMSAAARASMTSKCATAANTTKIPRTPRTVATVPSVRSAVENPVHGCHADMESTPSSDCVSARVSPPAAARIATAKTIHITHTAPNWPTPSSTRPTLCPSRRTPAMPSCTRKSNRTMVPAIQNVAP